MQDITCTTLSEYERRIDALFARVVADLKGGQGSGPPQGNQNARKYSAEEQAIARNRWAGYQNLRAFLRDRFYPLTTTERELLVIAANGDNRRYSELLEQFRAWQDQAVEAVANFREMPRPPFWVPIDSGRERAATLLEMHQVASRGVVIGWNPVQLYRYRVVLPPLTAAEILHAWKPTRYRRPSTLRNPD